MIKVEDIQRIIIEDKCSDKRKWLARVRSTMTEIMT